MSLRTAIRRAAVLAVLVVPSVCLAVGPSAPVQKALVADGHVVHNLGAIENHVTNWGLIGSRPGLQTTYSDAPSGYFMGYHHLWAAGLWVGGIVSGEPLVTTGGGPLELRPSDAPGDTIFPAFTGIAAGIRYPWQGANDDGDGAEDEDPLNGLDDDGDDLVDEDFAAIGDQHFRCVMADTGAVILEAYPDHTPLGLEIVQQSFQWSDPLMEAVIGYDFTVRNVGVQTVENVHCGLFSDFDISDAADDHAGSFRGFVQASDGSFVNVTLAWMRDGATVPQGGWMGWVMCGLVTDAAAGGPADPLAVSSFQRLAGNAAFDQGGDPTNDSERYQLLSADVDHWDPDSFNADDYRVLLSSEAVPVLDPGESLTFRMALVAGVDLDALVTAAAEAVLMASGVDFDRDDDPANGDEFHVPWLRPDDVPVPAVAGYLRAAAGADGVALQFELHHAEDLPVAVVRRAGPAVPVRRWTDVDAVAGIVDNDPVGWPRTYDLVVKAAGGADLLLDTVEVPGVADVLALTAGPNPFNPRVTLNFTLPRAGAARLDILDLKGRLVAVVLDEVRPVGAGKANWDGRDLKGRSVASGVYLVQLKAAGQTVSDRITLLR